ncbi:MAG: TetR/AcrR family transcriptional regulator C-terminal domain-containing protein [Thermoleophilia bacterium]
MPNAVRAPLSSERILRAALDLIDEGGLGELTMRRLGARLGVEAMSIYRHLPNKEAVIEGVRELILAELAAAQTQQPRAGGWEDALAGSARAFRRVCRRHPRALPLFAADADRAYAAFAGAYEPVLRRLVDDGFTEEQAIAALRIVVRHVLADGMLDVVTVTRTHPMTEQELARLRREWPLVSELVRAVHRGPVDELFEAGLRALIAGLSAAHLA